LDAFSEEEVIIKMAESASEPVIPQEFNIDRLGPSETETKAEDPALAKMQEDIEKSIASIPMTLPKIKKRKTKAIVEIKAPPIKEVSPDTLQKEVDPFDLIKQSVQK
jgi:hypothetical protein